MRSQTIVCLSLFLLVACNAAEETNATDSTSPEPTAEPSVAAETPEDSAYADPVFATQMFIQHDLSSAQATSQ